MKIPAGREKAEGHGCAASSQEVPSFRMVATTIMVSAQSEAAASLRDSPKRFLKQVRVARRETERVLIEAGRLSAAIPIRLRCQQPYLLGAVDKS